MSHNRLTKGKSKQKIIDAFWECFQEKSVEKITVSEIIAIAGINRSTFYAYFKDVYDVLEQIEDYYLPNEERIFEHHKNLSNEEIFNNFIKVFDANYKYISFLLSDKGDPNFANKLKRIIRPKFKQHLPEKICNSSHIDITIEFVLSSMIGVITYWANQPDHMSSKELFILLEDLYMNGFHGKLDLVSKRTL